MRRAAKSNGGAARRAITRWAWRMFRREWRRQALVLALLTVAVAAATGLASAAYTAAPVSGQADLGAGSHAIRLNNPDPAVLAADVAAAKAWFETAEVIYHGRVPLPGLFEPLDYRGQDPAGTLGGPRLALLEGDYPTGDQVAVTDGIAELLDLEIGGSLPADGRSRTVVGVVENPANLRDEFVLVAPSSAGDLGNVSDVTILVDATDERVRALRIPSGGSLEIASGQANSDLMAAVGVLVFETVALLFVALIAAASFIVIAQRRMRQLGMLAAIGATQKQLRLVVLVNGVLIGLVAAVIGAVIGFVGWVALAAFVEEPVGYRIDALDVPVWLIAGAMLLAVVASTAAAWWPARNVARVPAVRALSGRPPEPRPVHRATALAAGFALAGTACLVVGGDLVAGEAVGWTDALLLVTGTVAIAVAMLLASPMAIRVLAACTWRLPVTVRLAMGDLARYRARAGAALSAISLALGITVAIVALTGVAHASADEGNLAGNQVMVRAHDGPFIPEAADIARLEAAADRIRAAFGNGTITPLEAAVDPAMEPDPSFDGLQAVSLGRRFEDGWTDVSLIYVATPKLLGFYGYELGKIAPGTLVITREKGDLAIVGEAQKRRTLVEAGRNAEALAPGYGSIPGTFITEAALRERGWVAAPAGQWLIETEAAPTTEQLATARELAAGAGLTVEVRDAQGGLGALRRGATAVGVLVALGVIALTVGLVRGEAGRDLRILAATGATRRQRRSLTAATAGGLAVLGAILGIAAAYLGLAAGFARHLDELSPVPVVPLAVILLGLPVLATVVGWLASGRTIPDIARQPLQ